MKIPRVSGDIEPQSSANMLEMIWVIFCDFKHALTVLPNNSSEITNPREMKIYFLTKSCTQVLIAALIIIIQAGNNPNVHHLLNR